MKPRDRRVAVAIAVPGAMCCVAAVGLFVARIFRNDLALAETSSARIHYIQIGDAYTRGFVTGFFLCFFLMILAIAVGTLFEQRRARRDALRDGVRASASS